MSSCCFPEAQIDGAESAQLDRTPTKLEAGVGHVLDDSGYSSEEGNFELV